MEKQWDALHKYGKHMIVSIIVGGCMCAPVVSSDSHIQSQIGNGATNINNTISLSLAETKHAFS